MAINTLQESWEQETIPTVLGITFKNGKTLSFRNSQSECLSSYEFIENELHLEEYLEATEVQIYFELDVPDTHGKVIGGAVAMGNEGFILYIDKNGEIQWSILQTFANPFFNTTTVQGDVIHAITEIDYHWTIPIFAPQNLSCVSKNEWGY